MAPAKGGSSSASGGSGIVPKGMRGYTIVWSGQVVSFIGTGMKDFALIIWAWQLTGQATALALVAFFAFVPQVILLPFAGVLVDRWNRKWILALTDTTAGLASLGMLLLFLVGELELWHVYGLLLFAGTFQAFQFPAFGAATTMMVPKKHYGRANAMLTTAQAGSFVFSPILAAVLIGPIDISGILVIDVVTFLVALACLSLVPIPKPPESEEGRESRRNVVTETLFGFVYIFRHRPLLALQLILFAFNIISTLGIVILNPMILARTDNDTATLATVLSLGGVGGIVGGVFMAVWGGPKRKVDGLLMGLIGTGLGGILVGVGRGLPLWAVGVFIFFFTWPVCNASNQAIWQSKVPPDLQGRVFAVRGLIAVMGIPISEAIAGPMADWWLEPAMRNATGLAETLVGSGPGAGMSMMVLVSSVVCTFIGLAGYAFRSVRDVEVLLPDHEVAKGSEEAEDEQGAVGGGDLAEPMEPPPPYGTETPLERDGGND